MGGPVIKAAWETCLSFFSWTFSTTSPPSNVYICCVVWKRNRDTKVSAVTEWMRLIIRVQFIHEVLLTNRFFSERFAKNRDRDYTWMKGAVKS